MTDAPKTEEPTYSAAFEAIKPDLIAYLKEHLSVEVYSESYQSPTVSVTILLEGMMISSDLATLPSG